MTIIGDTHNVVGAGGGKKGGFASKSMVRAATTGAITLLYSNLVLGSPLNMASIQNAGLIAACAFAGETASRTLLPKLHLTFKSGQAKQIEDIVVQIGTSSALYAYAYPMVFGGAGRGNFMNLMRTAAIIDGVSLIASDKVHDIIVGEPV